MKSGLRKAFRWMHLWLGLILGVFICLMGFTGGLVALRPQIATLLSPPAATGNCSVPDWDRAATDITAFAHSEINRVYGPYGTDPRWHFRMTTDEPVIYKHVIYDACAGRVLGFINMGWMDWTVDLHHNLLAGRTGRAWAGAIGVLMLFSGLSGLLLWLLGNPRLSTLFAVSLSLTRRTPRELHRAFGVVAAILLALEAFTGLWLCFPQTMRGMLAVVMPVTQEARPPRAKSPGGKATFGTLIAAAHTALPDGRIREIRLPEGSGPVQVRMWLPGDFRALGNNVVSVSGADGRVLAVERYTERSASNRIIQAMAGLHYDEWGGLTFRVLSAVAGLITPLLYISGILIWWHARPRARVKPGPRPEERIAAAVR
jgi:uncharacterized iron-regulated membrane protein